VQELAKKKLINLIGLKYSAIHDTVQDLGAASEISRMFGGFQKYLY
jgi:hypothetical protein